MAPPAYEPSHSVSLIIGGASLVVVTALYLVLDQASPQPLVVFVLPSMVTAVIGGWRATLFVGAASLAAVIVAGLLSPMDGAALVVRWMVIATVVALAAIGALLRETQRSRLSDLNDAMALRAAFERALAPAPAPPPGFVVAARYQPATTHMQIGGDFLEAIAIADGRLAVLMGDVCGHGPREAAYGAALRAGWKSIALAGYDDPASWVQCLDDAFFRDGRIDTYATLCTGYLDLPTRTARLVNVGHPLPILLSRPARELPLPALPPLGLDLNDQWSSVELPWQGDPLLLYTDGLIENPQSTDLRRRWGYDGLVTWLDDQRDTEPHRLVRDLIAAGSRDRVLHDDVAVLLISAASRATTPVRVDELAAARLASDDGPPDGRD
jgi:serine phosphatase RsbU (regulator of sigma subunit)